MLKKKLHKLSILPILTIVLVFLVAIFLLFNKKKDIRDRLSEKNARAMVLSCMDFRFINDKINFLNNMGYKDDYDKFVLAGSSLGYNQSEFPEWGKSFDKHIELAIDLHNITEIIVLDHMDCGAYKILYDNQSMSNEEEYKLHQKNLNLCKNLIRKKFPSLKVTILLINIDGTFSEF
jgi:carbonic anhydrase